MLSKLSTTELYAPTPALPPLQNTAPLDCHISDMGNEGDDDYGSGGENSCAHWAGPECSISHRVLEHIFYKGPDTIF
jgi:hypothetical protein